MNPTLTAFASIMLFTFLICSSPALGQKGKNLNNVRIEFEANAIANGILDKFENFFESEDMDAETDIYDEDFIGEEPFYDEEDYDEYEYEEELIYTDGVDELNIIGANNQLSFSTDDSLTDHYKKFVIKLCLLTALSKEATIYATEDVTV